MTFLAPPNPGPRPGPPGMQQFDFIAKDGEPLRCAVFVPHAPRGNLILAGGRNDFYEKYYHAISHWAEKRWAVLAFDWRGHGGNRRSPGLGDTFAHHVADLAELARFWQSQYAGPRSFVAHSMGAQIILRALVAGQVIADGCALTSPLIAARSPFGRQLTYAWALAKVKRGHALRSPWASGNSTRVGLDHAAMLSSDPRWILEERGWLAARPELATAPPTYRWLSEVFAPPGRLLNDQRLSALTTSFVIAAAKNDAFCRYSATRELAKRLQSADLISFPAGVKHDLLRERDIPRLAAFAAIDGMLERL